MIRFTELLKQFRQVIITVAVLILIFLLWRGCGKKENKEADKLQAIIDTLQINEIAMAIDTARFSNRVKELSTDLYFTKDSLRVANERIKNLLSKGAKAVIRYRDARIIGDTAAALDDCDTMASTIVNLRFLYDDAATYAGLVELERDSILIYKDSVIYVLKKQNKKLVEGIGIVEKKLPTFKRRTEFYAGPSAIGSKETIFDGYGGGIGLLTKKGQLWEADALIINGKTYYQLGGKFRLSFRKH
jgi:hypothetical protein